MPNPLVTQGTLNRLRASVQWNNFPGLNVTAPYLGREGIKFNMQGESTEYFGTMTGAVTSPEPYLMFEMEINLLKSQALADAYKAQMELQSTIGDGSLRGDAATLGVYGLVNCSIKNVRGLDFSGANPNYNVTIGGYYLINSALFTF